MSDATRILQAIEQGDPHAAEQLLPLVYDELRRLAGQNLSQEKPGQTLQATALVHEAYIRLVDAEKAQHWDSRGHFFAAAAEAMRRILLGEDAARQTLRFRIDGAAHVSGNYEERTGLAVGRDLRSLRRVTVDSPALTSPHASGSLRYLDAVQFPDRIYYYYEYARSDGSHETRLSIVET